MTVLTGLAVVSVVLAALPVGLFFANLFAFRRAPAATARDEAGPRVSVLIPARDEARTIRGCVEAALASRDVSVEVVVLDDHSGDDTAEIAAAIAAADPRVRHEAAPPLPRGWCGKQHACHALSRLARHDLLLFVDADVRLAPDAAARAIALLDRGNAALVSGFPRQVTGSFLEKLLIPMIHVVLLGYLPVTVARWRATDPRFGAGCGQFALARRDAYEHVGGHAAIRGSLHDGITLPRAFRAAGVATDLFDATDTAACRMYDGNRACWNGLAKNATEGMADPRAIVPWTILMLGGHVLPVAALAGGLALAPGSAATWLAAAAMAALYLMRVVAAWRFDHPWLGVLLHPVAVLLLVVVQWVALLRHLSGRPAAWKGRSYAPVGAR
jgi:hypothetical protein